MLSNAELGVQEVQSGCWNWRMRETGMVMVSEERVFQRGDFVGARELPASAAEQYPDEQFERVEYNFAERRWGIVGPPHAVAQAQIKHGRLSVRLIRSSTSRMPSVSEEELFDRLGPARAALLRDYARDNWGDAEALIRFCKRVGQGAKGTLSDGAELQFQMEWGETIGTMLNPHDPSKRGRIAERIEWLFRLWLALFSDPETRNPAWR